jgi:thiamine biosynthesis lipoprotein
MPSPSPENSRPVEPTIEVIRARPLLGTLVQIQASGPANQIQHAVDLALAAIEHVQRLMSYHDPDSEISMLNREATLGPRQVHEDTYAVLAAALRFSRLSEGAFDPCVGSLLEQWGYLPTHDAPLAPYRACRPDWRDVELLRDRQVRFRRPLRLDLGGIAKGYAVDQAVRALQVGGAFDVLVNAGGDLRVWGEHTRSIEVRYPLVPARAIHAVPLRDAAIATSGAYYSRRQLGPTEVSALLDPRSLKPHLGADSVSVRAADCLSADALTKVVLFASPQLAEKVLAECDAEAFVQQPAGEGNLPCRFRRMAAIPSVTDAL